MFVNLAIGTVVIILTILVHTFGLIAVTGLRVSEAIALDNCDVDLATGVLTVRRGKSGKARIIPVSASTSDRLIAYAKERDRLLGCCPKCPAATCMFCSRTALSTSPAVRFSDARRSGSTQMRML